MKMIENAPRGSGRRRRWSVPLAMASLLVLTLLQVPMAAPAGADIWDTGPPWRAGSRIAGPTLCTGAFAANRNGQQFILTAAHCDWNAAGAKQRSSVSLDKPVGQADVVIGRFDPAEMGGLNDGLLTDVSLFAVDDVASWRPAGGVDCVITDAGCKPVVGYGDARVGDEVCIAGARPGRNPCGTVLEPTTVNPMFGPTAGLTLLQMHECDSVGEGDSGAPAYAAAPDVADYGGAGKVFARGVLSGVFDGCRAAVSQWSAIVDHLDVVGGWATVDPPQVAASSFTYTPYGPPVPGQEVVVQLRQNELLFKTRDQSGAWQPWSQLEVPSTYRWTGQPVITRDPASGVVRLFVTRKLNNRVWTATFDRFYRRWEAFTPLKTTAVNGSTLAMGGKLAGVVAQGRPQVFAATTAGRTYRSQLDGSEWSEWAPLDGGGTVVPLYGSLAAAVNSKNCVEVFAVAGNFGLSNTWQNPVGADCTTQATWQNGFGTGSFGGFISGGSIAAATNLRAGANPPANGRIEVFSRTTSGGITSFRQISDTQPSSGWGAGGALPALQTVGGLGATRSDGPPGGALDGSLKLWAAGSPTGATPVSRTDLWHAWQQPPNSASWGGFVAF